jgi:hypothetical protein
MIDRLPGKELNLNKWRYHMVVCFLPLFVSATIIGLLVAFGIGHLDFSFIISE